MEKSLLKASTPLPSLWKMTIMKNKKRSGTVKIKFLTQPVISDNSPLPQNTHTRSIKYTVSLYSRTQLLKALLDENICDGKTLHFLSFFFLVGIGCYSIQWLVVSCEHVKWFAVGNPSHKCSSAGIPLFIWDVTFVGFKYEKKKKGTSFLKNKE